MTRAASHTTAQRQGLTTLRPRHRFLPSLSARHLPARRTFDLRGVPAFLHLFKPSGVTSFADQQISTGAARDVGRFTRERGFFTQAPY